MDAVCTLMNDGATRHTERESKPWEGEAARGGAYGGGGAYEGLSAYIMSTRQQSMPLFVFQSSS